MYFLNAFLIDYIPLICFIHSCTLGYDFMRWKYVNFTDEAFTVAERITYTNWRWQWAPKDGAFSRQMYKLFQKTLSAPLHSFFSCRYFAYLWVFFLKAFKHYSHHSVLLKDPSSGKCALGYCGNENEAAHSYADIETFYSLANEEGLSWHLCPKH